MGMGRRFPRWLLVGCEQSRHDEWGEEVMAKDWESFEDVYDIDYFKPPAIGNLLDWWRTKRPKYDYKATRLKTAKGWRIWRRSK